MLCIIFKIGQITSNILSYRRHSISTINIKDFHIAKVDMLYVILMTRDTHSDVNTRNGKK